MNLKKLKGLRKISDLDKSEQTDKLKYELYNLILPFVRRYQPMYYPNYKGDLEDLASDFFVKFITEKGETEENLLDKFDPKVTTLPYLVKISVQRALIDKAREDKNEMRYDETYDEDSDRLSLDFLAGRLKEEELEQLEEMSFDDSDIAAIKTRFQEMSPEDKKRFEDYYESVKNVLSPNFKRLFSFLESDFESNAYANFKIVVSGTAPDYDAHIFNYDANSESDTTIHAANLDSAVRKAIADYPGAKVEKIESPTFESSTIKILGSGPEFTLEVTHDNGEVEEVPIRARHIESVKAKVAKMYPGAVIVDSRRLPKKLYKFFSDSFLKNLRRSRISDSEDVTLDQVFEELIVKYGAILAQKIKKKVESLVKSVKRQYNADMDGYEAVPLADLGITQTKELDDYLRAVTNTNDRGLYVDEYKGWGTYFSAKVEDGDIVVKMWENV